MLRQVYDEEEPVVAGMNHIFQDNSRSRSDNWSGVALDRDAASSDYDALHAFPSSTSELLFPASSTDHHRLRNRGAAYRIHPAFLHPAPSADRFLPSASADLKLPPATCSNAFRPARISSGRVPPPSAQHPRAKHRGTPQILSWLLPRSRRKAAKPPESETAASPSDIERENTSRLVMEWGALSLDSVRKELAEANEHRDAALREAAEVRASLGELATKLASLEAYCSKLKNALRHKTTTTTTATTTNSPSVSRRSAVEPPMPVSHEVMVEGFLQIASEARLSVTELCKELIRQAEGNDASDGLSDKLNLLLLPHHLTVPLPAAGTSSKAVLYHLESAMNCAMYQDFENCAFHRSGAPRCLDPTTARRQSFDAFVALRNLSWNEVLRKGTRYYSEDLSRFCDRKMAAVVAALMGWARPWPEQLLQCFFVAAKCVWLLHLLAFSFAPPLTILRVEDGRAFDQMYMEDILQEGQQQSQCQVKIMVVPGFYVQDRVLKCRVLTTSTSSEA
jgi:hypothetical protein